MDKVKQNNIPVENTATNMKGEIELVSPDALLMNEEKVEKIDSELREKAKDILQTQSKEKKFNTMIEIKIKHPDMKLMDFVRDYIGASNVEGCNYEELANEAESYFFKKIGKGLKNLGKWTGKQVGGAAKAVKNVAQFAGKGVSSVVGKHGILDKLGKGIDKATGGIASSVFDSVKDVVKSVPVVGGVFKGVEKIGGSVINAIDKAVDRDKIVKADKIASTILKKDPQTTPSDAVKAADLLGTAIAMYKLKKEGKILPIQSAQDGEIQTLKKTSQVVGDITPSTPKQAGFDIGGLFKNTQVLLMLGALVGLFFFMKKN